MGVSDIGRIAAFERRFEQAQATDVVDLGWGFGLLQRKFPLSEYHNRIVVTSASPPADVLSAAEELLGDAGLRHRYVSVGDGVNDALVPTLVAAGYEDQEVVTMIYAGPTIEFGAHVVASVSLETLRPSLIRNWHAEIPDATDELLRQLADRTALYSLGAELTLLAVYEGNEIAAHVELYVDRAGSVAQIENLVTHEQYRNRGYGDSLVRNALWRAGETGSELCVISADLDDWPRQWYQRLGYVDASRTHHFVRRDA
jgi:ribosomal protein S18 acetylase RimI-like enzyme